VAVVAATDLYYVTAGVFGGAGRDHGSGYGSGGDFRRNGLGFRRTAGEATEERGGSDMSNDHGCLSVVTQVLPAPIGGRATKIIGPV
jgi:hypothetical protein